MVCETERGESSHDASQQTRARAIAAFERLHAPLGVPRRGMFHSNVRAAVQSRFKTARQAYMLYMYLISIVCTVNTQLSPTQ